MWSVSLFSESSLTSGHSGGWHSHHQASGLNSTYSKGGSLCLKTSRLAFLLRSSRLTPTYKQHLVPASPHMETHPIALDFRSRVSDLRSMFVTAFFFFLFFPSRERAAAS